jgi:hypothetical protein
MMHGQKNIKLYVEVSTVQNFTGFGKNDVHLYKVVFVKVYSFFVKIDKNHVL